MADTKNMAKFVQQHPANHSRIIHIDISSQVYISACSSLPKDSGFIKSSCILPP